MLTSVSMNALRALRAVWLCAGVLAAFVALAEAVCALLPARPDHPRFMTRDYVMWRHAPAAGPRAGVDARGLRVTVNPAALSSREPAVVWLFGGATTWGRGVRDEETIASRLARHLTEAGVPAVVSNRGEWSYVAGHEAVALARELILGGERPDLVMFLDGAEDLALASAPGHQADRTFSWLHDSRLDGPTSEREDLLEFLSGSRLGSRLLSAPAPPAVLEPDSRAARVAIARRVARRYQASAAAVEALAGEFGFAPLLYWQPLPRTPVSRAAGRAVARAMAGRSEFHDLSGLFDTERPEAFFDGADYTGKADERIALRLSVDAARALERAR